MLVHSVYCKYKRCYWEIINNGLTPHHSSDFLLYQLLWPTVYILYWTPSFPSIAPTASRRHHVKLLSEQLKLHSIPPLLFLTSGDTVTVDLSSPIKEEVSHFSAPRCLHSFLSQFFSLKLAVLREMKSWRIERCSQAMASLTMLQRIFGISGVVHCYL